MAQEAILIIDDHALFRSGIVSMLSTAFDEIPVLDSASLHEALAIVAVVPTIVLLDIQLPGISGLEGMGLLQQRWPAARIVVVSGLDLPDTVSTALAHGACAFLSKADRPDRMMTVLREMLARSSAAPRAGAALCPTLTPRQAEVLTLVGRGLSNKMIGRSLGLSEHTIRGHVQGLLSVLGVTRRAEAVFKAQQLGLIR
ncbi:response regulator protein [Methylobacterium radiotolerans]|jgi:two-component system nitrate/nitrite response regulator NarL|uniref:response regulator n=1 Tax=Methylobacterium TaxID=407 RepID=UPI0005B8913B|nr:MULTISPECIES: response regulator transcription factor [Methylobacterium]MCY4506136.1 response regulator transcription factor [Acidobacteriota bacterium]GAN48144.1 two component LuxR family transcriptional regulator [Methylobacterium sp. ME121]KIU28855.1 response regulator protein [Methylobacterium radiotolerans]KTS12560.1 response regulator protein [Methylobacterium radiotolerans]KTS43895.1 response regulator protein [Methylobacterium radiotolerans]